MFSKLDRHHYYTARYYTFKDLFFNIFPFVQNWRGGVTETWRSPHATPRHTIEGVSPYLEVYYS